MCIFENEIWHHAQDATVEMLRDAIDEKLMPTLGRLGLFHGWSTYLS